MSIEEKRFVNFNSTTITGYWQVRAASFPISGSWGNYLEPIFFLVLGNLKFSIKYGEAGGTLVWKNNKLEGGGCDNCGPTGCV